MSEKVIAQLCSPTLAALKTAGLFTVESKDHRSLTKEIANYNRKWERFDLHMMVLGYPKKERALIYLFRPSYLEADLKDPIVLTLLRQKGYDTSNIWKSLTCLIRHLKQELTFPHEIGCFLGYPPEDIEGFIEGKKPCRYVGMWKVYSDVQKSQKLFRVYDACTKECLEKMEEGMSLDSFVRSSLFVSENG